MADSKDKQQAAVAHKAYDSNGINLQQHGQVNNYEIPVARGVIYAPLEREW